MKLCTFVVFRDLFVRSSSFMASFFNTHSQVNFLRNLPETAAADLDVLLHHHTAAQLLLGGQTQILHVRICAGDRTHAPHGGLGNGRRKGAVSCGGGLQFDASMEMSGRLLADVQTSLQKVSGRGHRGQRRRETG